VATGDVHISVFAAVLNASARAGSLNRIEVSWSNHWLRMLQWLREEGSWRGMWGVRVASRRVKP
jgi:hypothetical protein